MYCITFGLPTLSIVSCGNYKYSGNGKTHYIKKQLAKCADQLVVVVNEGFSPLGAITKLRSLPHEKGMGIFFNFTILPPGVSFVMYVCMLVYTLLISGFSQG
jgi:hypothetical protein